MKTPLMLVEDNPDHVLLSQRALKMVGLEGQMVVVPDGEQALSYLQGKGIEELPRVVLLDLNLPGISGLEVLKVIRSQGNTRILPVVILSTSDEVSDKRQAYELGANSYILKPTEFHTFFHMMCSFGEYWLSLNQAV